MIVEKKKKTNNNNNKRKNNNNNVNNNKVKNIKLLNKKESYRPKVRGNSDSLKNIYKL